VRQQIAGQLLNDEAVVGQVPVQRPDHPVAVKINLAGLVLLKTVAVGVTGPVQPEPAPALAVMGRGQQPLHGFLVGPGTCIGEKVIHLPDCREESDQVEAQAAEDGHPVRRVRGVQPFLFEAGQLKTVDGVARPVLVLDRGDSWANRRQEGPVVLREAGFSRKRIGPGSSGVNPGAEQLELVGRQPFAIRRHDLVVIGARHPADESAFGTMAGDNGRLAGFAPPQGDRADIEAEARLGLGPIMRAVAAGFEQGNNLPLIINAGLVRGRQPTRASEDQRQAQTIHTSASHASLLR
jgi:hypothetical protein